MFKIERGTNTLNIEADCSWGIPGSYTLRNFPCYEDGSNCVADGAWVDPSKTGVPHGKRAIQAACRR